MKGCVFMRTKIIDISKWNDGKLNWKKISTTVNGVIIRLGYRGYAEPGIKKLDPKFKEYANKCKVYKIPFGVYWFAQEITELEAEESAKTKKKSLKDRKKTAREKKDSGKNEMSAMELAFISGIFFAIILIYN